MRSKIWVREWICRSEYMGEMKDGGGRGGRHYVQ
jgi:hypothetical protein